MLVTVSRWFSVLKKRKKKEKKKATFLLLWSNTVTKATCRRKSYLCLLFQRDESLSWQRSRATSNRQEAEAGIWEPASSTRNTTHKFYEVLNQSSPWCTSSSKSTPPKPPQTAPPTGDQVYRCLSLWRTFSSIYYRRHAFDDLISFN